MKKIWLLSISFIVLLGGIIYTDYDTRLDRNFREEGIIIQHPFNQLTANPYRKTFSALANLSSNSHIIGAYYYIDDSNTDNYRFFTFNVFDLSYLFTDKQFFGDKYVYERYLKGTAEKIPDGSFVCRRLIGGQPAVLYYYQKDLGDDLLIPTKAAIICCNKKAYYLDVSAVNNVDEWFDKVEQSISFSDFDQVRIYGISFMILLSIAAAIILVMIVREAIFSIRKALKRRTRFLATNKKAYNLYRYIKAITILQVIIECGWIVSGTNEGWGMIFLLETLVKNGLMLHYLKKKVRQEYSEDYLVPLWFKVRFYKYLSNKSQLRTILLFLYMPLFYVIPLPLGTIAIVYYIIPVCLLTSAYFCFRWIKAGRNESL